MSPIETPEARKIRHHATLQEVTELSLDLARDAFAAAKEQLLFPPPAGAPDRSATFAKLVHEIRATVALEQRMDRPVRLRATRRRPAAPAARPTPAPAATPTAAPDRQPTLPEPAPAKDRPARPLHPSPAPVHARRPRPARPVASAAPADPLPPYPVPS